MRALGKRTRAMSRKLKGVETLSDDKTATKFFSVFQPTISLEAANWAYELMQRALKMIVIFPALYLAHSSDQHFENIENQFTAKNVFR